MAFTYYLEVLIILNLIVLEINMYFFKIWIPGGVNNVQSQFEHCAPPNSVEHPNEEHVAFFSSIFWSINPSVIPAGGKQKRICCRASLACVPPPNTDPCDPHELWSFYSARRDIQSPRESERSRYQMTSSCKMTGHSISHLVWSHVESSVDLRCFFIPLTIIKANKKKEDFTSYSGRE